MEGRPDRPKRAGEGAARSVPGKSVADAILVARTGWALVIFGVKRRAIRAESGAIRIVIVDDHRQRKRHLLILLPLNVVHIELEAIGVRALVVRRPNERTEHVGIGGKVVQRHGVERRCRAQGDRAAVFANVAAGEAGTKRDDLISVRTPGPKADFGCARLDRQPLEILKASAHSPEGAGESAAHAVPGKPVAGTLFVARACRAHGVFHVQRRAIRPKPGTIRVVVVDDHRKRNLGRRHVALGPSNVVDVEFEAIGVRALIVRRPNEGTEDLGVGRKVRQRHRVHRRRRCQVDGHAIFTDVGIRNTRAEGDDFVTAGAPCPKAHFRSALLDLQASETHETFADGPKRSGEATAHTVPRKPVTAARFATRAGGARVVFRMQRRTVRTKARPIRIVVVYDHRKRNLGRRHVARTPLNVVDEELYPARIERVVRRPDERAEHVGVACESGERHAVARRSGGESERCAIFGTVRRCVDDAGAKDDLFAPVGTPGVEADFGCSGRDALTFQVREVRTRSPKRPQKGAARSVPLDAVTVADRIGRAAHRAVEGLFEARRAVDERRAVTEVIINDHRERDARSVTVSNPNIDGVTQAVDRCGDDGGPARYANNGARNANGRDGLVARAPLKTADDEARRTVFERARYGQGSWAIDLGDHVHLVDGNRRRHRVGGSVVVVIVDSRRRRIIIVRTRDEYHPQGEHRPGHNL